MAGNTELPSGVTAQTDTSIRNYLASMAADHTAFMTMANNDPRRVPAPVRTHLQAMAEELSGDLLSRVITDLGGEAPWPEYAVNPAGVDQVNEAGRAWDETHRGYTGSDMAEDLVRGTHASSVLQGEFDGYVADVEAWLSTKGSQYMSNPSMKWPAAAPAFEAIRTQLAPRLARATELQIMSTGMGASVGITDSVHEAVGRLVEGQDPQQTRGRFAMGLDALAGSLLHPVSPSARVPRDRSAAVSASRGGAYLSQKTLDTAVGMIQSWVTASVVDRGLAEASAQTTPGRRAREWVSGVWNAVRGRPAATPSRAPAAAIPSAGNIPGLWELITSGIPPTSLPDNPGSGISPAGRAPAAASRDIADVLGAIPDASAKGLQTERGGTRRPHLGHGGPQREIGGQDPNAARKAKGYGENS